MRIIRWGFVRAENVRTSWASRLLLRRLWLKCWIFCFQESNVSYFPNGLGEGEGHDTDVVKACLGHESFRMAPMGICMRSCMHAFAQALGRELEKKSLRSSKRVFWDLQTHTIYCHACLGPPEAKSMPDAMELKMIEYLLVGRYLTMERRT